MSYLSRGVPGYYLIDTLNYANLKNFVGVFAANTFPYREQKYVTCIANTANLGLEGEHFLFLIITPNIIYVYDSLGMTINSYQSILKTLSESGKKVITVLSSPIQSIISNYCGFYCMFFAILCDQTVQNEEEIKSYFINDNNLLRNDESCIALLENYL